MTIPDKKTIVDMALDVLAAQLYERRKRAFQSLPCEPDKRAEDGGRGPAMWMCSHLRLNWTPPGSVFTHTDACTNPEFTAGRIEADRAASDGEGDWELPGHECWKAYAISQAKAAGAAEALNVLTDLLWDMLKTEMWLPCNVPNDPVGAGLPWHCPHLEFEHSAFCTIGSKCGNPEFVKGEDLADAVGEAYEFQGAVCWKAFALAAATRAMNDGSRHD
jgi:hypothetical protein